MFRVRTVFVAVVMFLFVVVAAPALVVCARSVRGRMEGVLGIAVVTFLVSGLIWLAAPLIDAERPAGAGYVALAGLIALVPLGVLAAALQRTYDYGAGPIGSHFLRAEPAPESVGWADLEDEYVWLLIQLITRIDPRMPAAEARATRAKVDELLTAVAELPDYGRLARISDGQGYRLIRGALDPQHCYSYRPEPRTPGEQFGLLVFLHGHGNNYLFMVHALRALCDRLRLCLVAPSFGYGNWEAPGGVEAVERATRFGLAAFDPHPARVFLGGISQGGAGVGRAAAVHPNLFAGLIFLSPTMELEVIGSESIRGGGGRGGRYWWFQGDRDRNVSPESVTAGARADGGGRGAGHAAPRPRRRALPVLREAR